MMNWGNYGWGMGFGWIYMIIFWVLVILGILYLVKLFTRGTTPEDKYGTPLEILKQRYAKGEITREEFEKMRDELMKR
jgi:putative membrane protein